MNSLTSSISKMMQRPQPPAAPTVDKEASSEQTQPVIDSDGVPTEAEMAAMQPSMSYASRVPPQQAAHLQSQNAASQKAAESSVASMMRRPILQRGSSGPAAPENGSAAGTAQARPGARAMGPASVTGQPQSQPPQEMPGLGGFDSGDGMGQNLPKAKVRCETKA
jgi:hypothetical protein